MWSAERMCLKITSLNGGQLEIINIVNACHSSVAEAVAESEDEVEE